VYNAVVKDGKILKDWSKSWLASVYKGKGDALESALYHRKRVWRRKDSE